MHSTQLAVVALIGLAATAFAMPATLFDAHRDLQAHEMEAYGVFGEFVAKHGKTYSNKAEVLRRFNVFRQNMAHAARLQQKQKGTARFGATRYSDMTVEEFQKAMLPSHFNARLTDVFPPGKPCDESIYVADVPDSFSWLEKPGVVQGVKDQGMCGSCWAFSAVGNIEGQYALVHNKSVSLSEQNLVDCDKVDLGCGGGLMLDAYKEIKRFGGLETEKDYPYHARDQKCQLDKTKVVAKVKDSCEVKHCEKAMKAYLHQVGPLAIALNANPLQFYDSGIIRADEYECEPEYLNHGLLLVGYGVEKDQPYWLIKNSWGTSWGEKGFFRLYRGENVCGVNEYVFNAFVQ